MFYYGGISECIDELLSCMHEQQKVPICGSVLSLLLSCDIHFDDEPNLKDRVRDELYSPLPESIKREVDILYMHVKELFRGK